MIAGRHTVVHLLIWLLAVAGLIAALVAISGCAAPLPICETFRYQLGENEAGQMVFVLDQANAAKMAQMVRGLAKGECRVEIPGET